jgi:hypothetical protein
VVEGLLGEPSRLVSGASDSRRTLDSLLALGADGGPPFYLLLDDADSMPSDTIEALVNELPSAHSPLRILLTVNPDSKGSRLITALRSFRPTEIPYRLRMTFDETLSYPRKRMRWAGFSEAEIAPIGHHEGSRLHALSGGIPREIHRRASALFERNEHQHSSALDEKYRRKDWMGRPIDGDLEI